MERRDIEQLVNRWLQGGICRGNVAVFDELLTENARDLTNGNDNVPRGRDSFKARASAVHAAFSDIEAAAEQLLLDGEHIAWRWSLTGTHIGSFAGVAATGRRVTLRGVNFQRLERAENSTVRVSEHWTLADVAGLLAALR